jgi:dTDP-4-dehydrorhamnose reductase
MGTWAARNGATVLHVSTDYVFDGHATSPYRTDAATAPANAYGRSKLAGERQLAATGARHLVFRTAWLYSASHPSFLGTMLRLARERDELRVVADQVGSPTSARTLAAAIGATLSFCSSAAPANDPRWGIHHVVAAGKTSWHGFATAIITEAYERGILTSMPRVTPIVTTEFPTPAHRPAYSVLDTSRFTDAFGWQAPAWQEPLAVELNELTS